VIRLTQICARCVGEAKRCHRELRGGAFKFGQLLIIHCVVSVGGTRQMAHHPFGVKRIPELFIPRKFLELFFVKAKAVHACIDMDGRIRRLIHAITNLRPKPRLLQRVDNGFELRAQQHTFIPWRWAIKHINRRIRSNTITQDFTFARRGHEKDTASRAVKRTSHLGCAKAISICFHRGSNFGCANTFFETVPMPEYLNKSHI